MRPQRDPTDCTICACHRVCLPACTRGERCSPSDPEWGLAAPASPRCWSSENNLNKVSLPPPAPSSPRHSPSARGSLFARLFHTLLRAAQVAMIALLRAREHLEHALAQLDLLYKIARGPLGRLVRARVSLRAPCDRVVSVPLLHGCTLHCWHCFCACGGSQMRMYMIVLSVVVVQWSYIKWGEQWARSRERPHACT